MKSLRSANSVFARLWARFLAIVAVVRRRIELRLLIGALLLILGLWAFASLASEVVEGDTGNLDKTILLAMRNPVDVNPWAMLLVCGYPVIETLFSVYRRTTRKRRHNPGTPDASHLHSLVYRRVVSRKLLPYAPAWQRNAATSPLMWIYAAVPMLGAVFWPASLGMVLAWLAFSVVASVRLYRRMLVLGIFFRRRAS